MSVRSLISSLVTNNDRATGTWGQGTDEDIGKENGTTAIERGEQVA